MIGSTTNRIMYAGNGVLDTFPYTFKILADSDLIVYVSAVLQTLDVQYTVTEAGEVDGGNVVFGVDHIPANEAIIVIIRNLPTTQLVDYTSGGRFPAETHETALDRLIMINQRLLEKLGRVPMTNEVNGLSDIELAAPGAGKYLRWNVAGDGIDAIEAVEDLGNFTQSGVGAVARTAISKIGEILSIKDFGAVGDGVTDDTTAIQAAIDAAKTSRKSLYFPAGRYYVTTSLDATLWTTITNRMEGVKVFGDGSGFSQIIGKLSAAQPILDFTGSARVHLEGLQVYGDPTGSQSAGILFARVEAANRRGDHPYLEDVMVQGKFSKASIGFVSADLSTMLHCDVYNSADARVLVYGSTDVEGITSAYQTFSSVTGNTRHELFGCNIIAQGDITGALRFDGGAELALFSVYFSLQADAGVQAAIETTGTGGNQICAHNIRMENSDNGATYHLITFTTSSTGGHIQGNADINGTDAIFNIPSGKAASAYHFNVTLATSGGRKYFAGGGDIRTCYVTNNQNLTATLGNSSYSNVILMASGANEWDISTYGNIVLNQTRTNFGPQYLILDERTDPGNSAANTARIYVKDNGGKTELVVVFPSGAVQQLAIEL